MAAAALIDTWLERFPSLRSLHATHLASATVAVHFPVLDQGDIAYRQGDPCNNYVMCLEGGTRTYKLSDQGREVSIYQVETGGTCLLTTHCLLSGSGFPAESVAVQRTRFAALPTAAFRELMHQSSEFRVFVLNDYARLMGQLFTLVDDLAFATVERRLARRLIIEAGSAGIVEKTHQQLAADIGSVREVVSRHLGEWERAGLIGIERGRITIRDREGLAGQRVT